MTSETATDFEPWLAEAYAAAGSFTALIVLVRIGGTEVSPVCSTYVNVIGPDVSWGDMTVMLAGAGQKWTASPSSLSRSAAGLSTIPPRACGCACWNSGSTETGWC